MPTILTENKTTAPSGSRALFADVQSMQYRPHEWARYAWRWGDGELAGVERPRAWQDDVLLTIQNHLLDEKTRYTPLRIAVRSGHGIGKSALMGMLSNWGMSTHTDARINITANTDTQLSTKTSPEVGKWFKRSITADWFDIETRSIKTKVNPQAWRMDFVPWSERNPEAFAGLHNKDKIVLLLMDEGSAVPDIIWETSEGAMTDENTIIIFVVFGNPTRNVGRFSSCWGQFRKRWTTWSIDSRDVEGTNKELLKEWEEAYGEDSDFFKVRCRGLPPKASTMQLIPTDLIQAARNREPVSYIHDPLIWGLDTARFGDDSTVLAARRGFDARTHKMYEFKNIDTPDLVGWMAEMLRKHTPDACFIDMGNTGASVYDYLHKLGFEQVIGVWFGGKPDGAVEGIIVLNKRTEMYLRLREWLRSPLACISKSAQLEHDLTSIEYGYYGDQTTTMIEKKADMKKRDGGGSPDFGDALALTFAYPVFARNKVARDIRERATGSTHTEMAEMEYDRHAM
jgi:hypothetical protein